MKTADRSEAIQIHLDSNPIRPDVARIRPLPLESRKLELKSFTLASSAPGFFVEWQIGEDPDS